MGGVDSGHKILRQRSIMPLNRVALLQNLIVPDPNYVKYPAQEIKKHAKFSEPAGDAKTVVWRENAKPSTTALSPHMLSAMRRIRLPSSTKRARRSPAPAAGHARAYIQLKRTLQLQHARARTQPLRRYVSYDHRRVTPAPQSYQPAVHEPVQRKQLAFQEITQRSRSFANQEKPRSTIMQPRDVYIYSPRENVLPRAAPVKLAPISRRGARDSVSFMEL